jgi:hypothetical protein
LEDQIKEVVSELSLPQYKIKLLYKKLNEATAILGQACGANTERGVCEESTVSTTWRKASSEYSWNKNELVNLEQLHSWRPISVAYRYSVLSHLPDSMKDEVETASLRSKKLTQFHTNYHKKYNEPRGVKNSSLKNCLVQQSHSVSVQVSRNDLVNYYKNDSHTNCIPVLVNGQVCSSKKDRNRQRESDNKSHLQSLLCAATWKLIVNKKSFPNCCKHKILLIGDSYLCGYMADMKIF